MAWDRPDDTSPEAGRPRVLLVITRGERGGAQNHVLELVTGLLHCFAYTVVVGDEEHLAPALRGLGVRVEVLTSLQRSVSPRSDVATLAALRALIRTTRPALVHTHSSKAGVLGRLAARLEGVPAIHTAHAWSFSDGQPKRRIALSVPVEAALGRITPRFIVVSDADGEVARRRGVATAAQIRVVYNGLSDVAERANPGGACVPVVTMVARLAAPKDPLLLLRALARVKAPIRVQLVGDGPERATVEAAARDAGLLQGGRVAFLGARGDVASILSESHVGLLVSRQEGFPLVVLEAMRAGLPVIASDVGGIREAVAHGSTGLLVPRGDERALAAALESLATDPARRELMGAAGRRRFERQFTVEHMLAGTRAVYAELGAVA
jgi:glycosyltransferase involved in cell wall biosynthesis